MAILRAMSAAAVAAFSISMAVAASGGGPAKDPWEQLPKSGEATVRVTFPDGKPADGATVTIGRKRYVADGDGRVKVPAIPAAAGIASATIVRKEGRFLGLFGGSPVRYAAFLAVSPGKGVPLDIPLPLGPVAEMDRACRSCHPDKPAGVSTHYRCVHPSGVPVKPEQEAQVKKFNNENEDLRKSGRPANPAIVLEAQKTGKDSGTVSRYVMVCGSCHSNHVWTGYRAFVSMPFEDRSVLCNGCHV